VRGGVWSIAIVDEDSKLETRDRVADIVSRLLAGHGFVQAIGPDDDLGQTGLSSSDMVNLMLTVEDTFAIKIPDQEMRPANFRSIARIDALVCALLSER
jgi:acyl carrier protein